MVPIFFLRWRSAMGLSWQGDFRGHRGQARGAGAGEGQAGPGRAVPVADVADVAATRGGGGGRMVTGGEVWPPIEGQSHLSQSEIDRDLQIYNTWIEILF